MAYLLKNRKLLLSVIQNLAIVSIFLTALFYCLQGVHPYAGWGGDYAGYITQAREFLKGNCVQPYYLYNPKQAYLSPPVYPMGYPLFISLFYRGFDNQDFIFYGQINSVLWWLSGIVLFFLLKSKFNRWPSLIVSLFWLFNPIFFQFKISLLPDVLSTLCFLLATYWYALRPHTRWYDAAICGFFAGYAMLSRFNCAMFILVVPLHSILEYWRSKCLKQDNFALRSELQYVVILISTAVMCQLAVRLIVHLPISEGSYLDQLKFGQFFPQLYDQFNVWVSEMMRYYQLEKELVMLFLHEPVPAVMSLGGTLAIGFIFMGLIQTKTDTRQDRFLRLLAVMMALLVIFWPMAQSVRYSMPVFALFAYFLAKGVDVIPCQTQVSAIVKWGLFPLMFAGTYHHIDQSIIRMAEVQEIGGPQFKINQDAFDYVRNQLPEDAIVATHQPLILGLYGQRKSCKWYGETPEEMESFFIEKQVRYLLINNWVVESDKAIQNYLLKNKANFDTIWQNERNVLLIRH
ncbi:MAG: glycosyltransferase family 39 protein [Bacteroidota bacterium]